MRTFAVLVFAAGLSTTAHATHSQEPSEAILHLGSFHDGEVPEDAGGEWIGLTAGANGWTLRPVTASIHTVHDPIADMDHENTGVEVRVADGPEVSWLIRSPRIARTGRVDGMSGRPLAFGEQQDLGGGVYVGLLGSADGTASLVLSSPAGTQTLVHNYGTEDSQPRLLFAGDLDGDGSLDLIIDETDHYNVSAPALFLSSAKGPGELLGRVASMVSVGC